MKPAQFCRVKRLLAILAFGSGFFVEAGVPAVLPADDWVTNAVIYPRFVSNAAPQRELFATLMAEPVAGKLRIWWQPSLFNSNSTAILWTSFDAPGHWPSRDWRSRPMTGRGGIWDARLAITELDVPVVYFVEERQKGRTNVSAMRACHPQAAGLEMPSRMFWPFIEGFEEGLESWQLHRAPKGAEIKEGAPAFHGRFALEASLPAGSTSMVVATTRIRGWQLTRHGVNGIGLYLRMRTGSGRARFAFLTNTGTRNEKKFESRVTAELKEEWKPVELPLESFPELRAAAVDSMLIEFFGEGPAEFLIDDVWLLGPWRPGGG